MSGIIRHLPGKRMCEATIFNNCIWTVQVPESGVGTIQEQTAETLSLVDKVLTDLGSNKSRILECTVFLSDITADYTGMNEAWDAWVAGEGNAPVRCCVEAKLAKPEWKIEIRVVAATGQQ